MTTPFCRGVYAQDQGPRGKAIDYRVPVEMGGVRIAPGDLATASASWSSLAQSNRRPSTALEKASTKNKVAVAIRQGMSAREAFDTFGVP